jgi:hypothetical protein
MLIEKLTQLISDRVAKAILPGSADEWLLFPPIMHRGAGKPSAHRKPWARIAKGFVFGPSSNSGQ